MKKISIKVKRVTSWKRALNAARQTVGKKALNKEPSDEWKDSILYAEHSPIRLIEYDIQFKNIPNFVAGHLVRHFMGTEKFVESNRQDRTGKNPTEINRLTPVNMNMTCNAQALINISRKRLCSCASAETRMAWKHVKKEVEKIDPLMAKHMVPECVYRGFCPEINTCGFCGTKEFIKERTEYIKK